MSQSFKQFARMPLCSLTTFILVLVFAFVLSGCGGGGGGSAGMDAAMMPGTGDGTGGGETPMEPPTPMPYVVDGLVANPGPSVFANSDADTLENVLAAGAMLAPLTVGTERGGGVVNALKDGTTYLKSISSDGMGGFHVNYVLGGEETPIHLTISDLYQNRYEDFRKVTDDGSQFWYLPYSTLFSSLFTYFDARTWQYIPPSGSGLMTLRGVFTYGSRTSPENLPAMGSAIYEGQMRGDIWNADDASFGSSRRRLHSYLTLKANFDDGEISGWINRFTIRSSRDDGENSRNLSRGNLITISGGEIDDGRFTADWTGSDSNMDPDPNYSVGGFSGKMLGEFFGPAGEEVGGVLNGNRAATASTPEQHFYGLFGGVERSLAVRDSTEEFERDLDFTLVKEFSGAELGTRMADQGEAYVKSIAEDGAGGGRLTYVINGVESVVDFTAADLRGGSATLGKVVGDNEYYFWRFNMELNYAEVIGWIHAIYDSNGDAIKTYRGHNVYGRTTEKMPTTGSATYEGRLAADFWNVNQPDDRMGRTRLRTDLTLVANFATSGISGRFDGLWIRGPGESDYEPMGSGNTLELSNGEIAESGFEANWTGMDTDTNSAPEDSVRGFSGTMEGRFYGPAAEEVAGVLNGSRAATASIPETLILGSFGARKME